MPGYEGRLELTWTNKHLRLLAHEDGSYAWLDPSDYRVADGRTRSVVEIGDRGPGDLLESPGRELDQTHDAASALPKMAGARLVARRARYKARKWMAHRARTPRYRTSSTVCAALTSGNLMTDPAGSAGGAPTNTPTMTKTATRRMPPTIPAGPPYLKTPFACSIFCTSFISLSCTIRACLGQSLSYIPPTHFLRVLCPWSG